MASRTAIDGRGKGDLLILTIITICRAASATTTTLSTFRGDPLRDYCPTDSHLSSTGDPTSKPSRYRQTCKGRANHSRTREFHSRARLRAYTFIYTALSRIYRLRRAFIREHRRNMDAVLQRYMRPTDVRKRIFHSFHRTGYFFLGRSLASETKR